MQSYRDLVVWQKSISLVMTIYALVKLFPKEEMFGITSQMKRAAVSIPSNIAEGYTRKHRAEYSQFIRIAFGSGAELETQLEIAKQLKLVPLEKFRESEENLLEVMKILNKLSHAISK